VLTTIIIIALSILTVVFCAIAIDSLVHNAELTYRILKYQDYVAGHIDRETLFEHLRANSKYKSN